MSDTPRTEAVIADLKNMGFQCSSTEAEIHLARLCVELERELAAGVDLYTISKILGHSTIQVTQRYAHLETRALKKAMRKIG